MGIVASFTYEHLETGISDAQEYGDAHGVAGVFMVAVLRGVDAAECRGE
jgi:hypothetical protein